MITSSVVALVISLIAASVALGLSIKRRRKYLDPIDYMLDFIHKSDDPVDMLVLTCAARGKFSTLLDTGYDIQ